MKAASIDIGTNTLRLLVADVEGGVVKPVFYDRKITRLGGAYDHDSGIHPDSAERTLAALAHFRELLNDNGVETVLPVATSVVRRAANMEWFVEEARTKYDLDIKVLTGEEEAKLTLKGVKSIFDKDPVRMTMVDIGGGSTEFVMTIGEELRAAYSLDMGVVHLTEKFLKSDPTEEREMILLEDAVEWHFRMLEEKIIHDKIHMPLYSKDKGGVLVGTAGTVTTLAAIIQELPAYDREKVNNFELNYWEVEECYHTLLEMPISEREKVLSLEKGREDLIIAGTAIVLKAMKFFDSPTMVVSDSGLLEGVLLASPEVCA